MGRESQTAGLAVLRCPFRHSAHTETVSAWGGQSITGRARCGACNACLQALRGAAGCGGGPAR